MLKLKLQYFGHLMQRANSLEKTLLLGKIEGRRRSGQQSMRWLDGITDSMDIEFEQTAGNGEGQGSLVCCSPRGHKESDPTEWLNSNNLEIKYSIPKTLISKDPAKNKWKCQMESFVFRLFKK